MQNKSNDDLVCLADIDPSIVQSKRYYTSENFVGQRVAGYNDSKIMLRKTAALALKNVQSFLKTRGYTLVVYDGYRPQEAVNHFFKWSLDSDISKKSSYYPTIDKKNSFKLGYISKTSVHCKGYAADLTIMCIDKKLHHVVPIKRTLINGDIVVFLDDGTVDMGTSFDLFHEASGHNTELISNEARKKRDLLKKIMADFGFDSYRKEWWHYTYESK